MFNKDNKIEIVKNYIQGTMSKIILEDWINETLGETWNHNHIALFSEMTCKFENVFFYQFDKYIDTDWLAEIIYEWCNDEVKGQEHMPFSSSYDVSTIDKFVEYIVNCFKNDKDNT